ncbi:MAG: DUF2505 family protein [Deltaproteobacteria bacterium]|nr:DUF2505 family protein [Deltaproteobacteria bacterium]
MKFRAEHSFRGISLADYEQLYFNEDFNAALCKAVKLARALEKRDLKDGKLSRVVRVGPDREIPPPVAKLLGASRIEYTEHLTYTFRSYNGVWHTVSSVFTDKIDSRGTFGFSAVKDGVTRVVEGDIKVKVFGIGGVIERFIVADVERSYKDAAQFTQRFIDGGGKA